VWLQGVVIGVGEQSEFGSVFKMMCSEEVRVFFSCYSLICGTLYPGNALNHRVDKT